MPRKIKNKKIPPAKRRYDRNNPTVSTRMTKERKEKLAKYKKPGMTWSDVAAEGLKYKEMGMDKENVITVLQKMTEEMIEERIKRAEVEILEKTEKMAYDVFVKEIKEELEKTRKQREEYPSEMPRNIKVFSDHGDNISDKVRAIDNFLLKKYGLKWYIFLLDERSRKLRYEDG